MDIFGQRYILFFFQREAKLKKNQNFMEYAYVTWKNGSDKFCNFGDFVFLGNDVLFALPDVLQLVM